MCVTTTNVVLTLGLKLLHSTPIELCDPRTSYYTFHYNYNILEAKVLIQFYKIPLAAFCSPRRRLLFYLNTSPGLGGSAGETYDLHAYYGRLVLFPHFIEIFPAENSNCIKKQHYLVTRKPFFYCFSEIT